MTSILPDGRVEAQWEGIDMAKKGKDSKGNGDMKRLEAEINKGEGNRLALTRTQEGSTKGK
jgi:hypothetical protein